MSNFCMSLTYLGIGQSSTPFTFSSSIFIPSGPITTPRNLTSFTFHLYFSSFTYRLFSASLFTTFSTSSSCPSSPSVPIIILFVKLTTFPVLIRSYKISFIIVWNIASEFVNPKNIIVGLNDPSGVVNTTFHSSPSFILILLYPHHKSIFVNTLFVLMFSTMSEIKGKG